MSTVIDQDALYRASGLSAPDLPIEVALIGPDGLADDGQVFFGDPAILAQDPETARVALPFGAWEMAAIPRGGWRGPPGTWAVRALFLGAALLIVVPILGAAWHVETRQSKLALIRDREAELSRLSWRLEFALAASQVGVWDVDLATDELLWDDRAKQLFGFAGRTGMFSEADWTGVLHPEDRDRAIAEAEAAVAGERKFATQYRVVHPDGEVRHIRDMAALYQGEDGSRRLVGLVWDVTADVERQEELNLRRLEAETATRRQIAIPRRDEPRDPHPARRRARAARADAERAARRQAARAGADRVGLVAEPAGDPQRHPRLLQARSQPDPHQRGERRRAPPGR